MSPTTSRISKALVTAFAMTAVVAPVAGAEQDLRSPDAVDAAVNQQSGSYTPSPGVDLRSPDAVDSAVNPQSGSYTPSAGVDLRSPDAVDAARSPQLATYSPGVASSDDSGGTDWGTAAMISGGALCLILLATGLFVGLRRRHQTAKPQVPAISS